MPRHRRWPSARSVIDVRIRLVALPAGSRKRGFDRQHQPRWACVRGRRAPGAVGERRPDSHHRRRLQGRPRDQPPPVRAVRRAPRQGHLRGHLGRSRLADSEHPRHPQRRRRGAQRVQGAQRAMAGRLLRRRVPLAQGHRPAERASGHAQPELGRRHRAEHVRHARVPRLRRSDRQRGLPLGQPRLGHAAGSRGMAGVPDRGAADGSGQGARRQRS